MPDVVSPSKRRVGAVLTTNKPPQSRLSAAVMALALISTTFLADCGGGSNSNSSGPPAIAAPNLGRLALSVMVPRKGLKPAASRRTSSVRHAEYLTSSVQSIVFTQTLSGGVTLSTPTVTTLTVGVANCTSNAGAQTCSAVLSAPLGADKWTVSAYASTNGTGTPLSIGVLPFTIVGGTTNTASLTLNPAVNSIAFAPASASCPSRSACTTPVVLEALDATGAVIIGSTPFAETTGGALAMSLSADSSLTTQTSAGTAAATSMTNATAINLSKAVYDGTSSGIKTLTASAGTLLANFTLTLTTHLYVCHWTGSTVGVYVNGTVTTPALSGLSGPAGVAVDAAGNIYVANITANNVQIFTSTGAVSSIAGGTITGLSAARGVAVDSAGNIYVANTGANNVKIFTSTGAVSSIAGGTISGLSSPDGIAVDAAGNIYVANGINLAGNVKIFSSTGAVSSIAGGTITGLNNPEGVAVDSAGNIYVANFRSANVKIYTTTGAASAIAGGTITGLNQPYGVAVDSSGNMYVADFGANHVKIYSNSTTAGGVVNTSIAGGNISGGHPIAVAVY